MIGWHLLGEHADKNRMGNCLPKIQHSPFMKLVIIDQRKIFYCLCAEYKQPPNTKANYQNWAFVIGGFSWFHAIVMVTPNGKYIITPSSMPQISIMNWLKLMLRNRTILVNSFTD